MDGLEPQYYWWWIAALVLLGIEAAAPGIFFLWLAIAAGIVGVLLLALPTLGWHAQVLVFAVLSVAAVVAWRAYLRRYPPKTDAPSLNRRGEQIVGRVLTLAEPIVNGRGTARVGDSIWAVEGRDAPAGTKVRVTGADGTKLKVEPAE